MTMAVNTARSTHRTRGFSIAKVLTSSLNDSTRARYSSIRDFHRVNVNLQQTQLVYLTCTFETLILLKCKVLGVGSSIAYATILQTHAQKLHAVLHVQLNIHSFNNPINPNNPHNPNDSTSTTQQ